MEKIISKYLCYQCISNSYLKSYLIKNGELNNCTFCKKHQKSISLEYLADWIDKIFHDNFRPLSTLEILNKHTNNENFLAMSPQSIIEIILESDSTIAKQIVNYLIDKYFFKDKRSKDYMDYKLTFEEKPVKDIKYSKYWTDFCKNIKHHQRFFNSNYLKKLEDIFAIIMNYRFSNNKTAIYEIKPNSEKATIFRARVADEKIRKKVLKNPHKELSAPPLKKSKPGRMNPVGISIFYGAFEKSTCIAEIRPPVDAIAVIGEFKIIKPIHVLDLTLFDDPCLSKKVWPSMFHPKFNQKIRELKFIKKFHYEISKPILRNGEPLEYIPTQAFTEFLANHCKPKLDGIIFTSSLTGKTGKNITLFNTTTMIENSIASAVENKFIKRTVLTISTKNLEIVKIVKSVPESIQINNPAVEPQNIHLI
ncbi:MAG: RES family NAD+ phosphorylase [Candidatus Zhuqueibacterota bacterium]